MAEYMKYFEPVLQDLKYVTCTLCGIKISRGSADKRKATTSSLTRHLENKHMEQWSKICEAKKKIQTDKRKREDSEEIQVFNLRNKKSRETFIKAAVPDWAQSKEMLPIHSRQAKNFHRSIFEHLVLDMLPWTHVNGPGFIAHHARYSPTIEIASEKHYRDMLDPIYEEFTSKLKSQIEEDNPSTVSAMLDGWSAFHHGYLGVNVTYLHDWKRKQMNLACKPFDVSHTGENLYNALSTTLDSWDLSSKVYVCLRDNASNMKSCFNQPGCIWVGEGCLIHSLQLVIQDELFNLPSISALIKHCKEIASFCNSSNQFYNELMAQQGLQMPNTPKLSLINDCPTRFFQYYNFIV